MAQYDITYACGYSSTVNLIGRHSVREQKLARLKSGDCFDCYKEKRTQAAQIATKERELLPLVGSENQIKWALPIRIQILDKLEDMVTQSEQVVLPPEEEQLILQVIDALYKVDSAHQWIEWRDWSISRILRDLKEQLLKAPTPAKVAHQQQQELERAQAKATALAEATLRPEQPITDTLAEITYTEDVVRVRFPENREDFNSLVRHRGYSWDLDNRRWERKLRIGRTGPARERAIEVGHILLTHRFCVCAFDENLRSDIIAGTFEPEQTRWIAVLIQGEYAGWLYVEWGKDEDFYEVARRIHQQSRYVKPGVAVPPVAYDRLLDFAERYNFRLTTSAQEAVKLARKQHEAILVVQKEKPPAPANRVVASTALPVLEVPEQVEVDEEFLDNADHD